MNKQLIAAAIVGGALLVAYKRGMLPGMTTSNGGQLPPRPATNINSDMWARLLGGDWLNIANAQNRDGSPAFLMRDRSGRVVTSDGKPVTDGSDQYGYFIATQTGLPDTYNEEVTPILSDLFGTRNRLDPMAGFRNPNVYGY